MGGFFFYQIQMVWNFFAQILRDLGRTKVLKKLEIFDFWNMLQGYIFLDGSVFLSVATSTACVKVFKAGV